MSSLGALAQSIGVGAHGLVAIGRCDGIPCDVVDSRLDELDRAVHEQHVHTSRVERAGIHAGHAPAAVLRGVRVLTGGPVGRDRCYKLFTAPVMIETFAYWRNHRK